jgi:predicted nucleotidyltransferase
MVKIPLNIKNIIDRYLEELKQNNITIQKAYLFGSYANGKHNFYSDIDLALVSNIFSGSRINDKDKVRRYTLNISSLLEVIPFNPNDFNRENPFACEIMDNGIQIL